MTKQAVIFDLDGTLLDTLADIGASMNQVLSERGYPVFPIRDYRHKVGDGIDTLAKRTVPTEVQTPELLAACVARNREIYATRWNRETRPYAGIDDMLRALVERGLKQAVLSNKPHEPVVRCVEHYFSHIPFEHVYGVGGSIPKKPDPAGVRQIMAAWGLPKEAILYVGDTNTDMQTAVAAGLYAVGVTWGFRDREELEANGANVIIDHPEELLSLLD
ncbi:MAG: HAD family hydrolase [Acidobacteriota bacterium]|nr:HAD family hydrolase [Acidobacteriota bacterium]